MFEFSCNSSKYCNQSNSVSSEETTVLVAILSIPVGYNFFFKALIKIISAKERLFVSLVGPSGSE